MKQAVIFKFIVLLFIMTSSDLIAQQPENWTKDQLMEPSELAAKLQMNKSVPVIFSVGPGALIPRSIEINSVKEEQNLKLLRKKLKKLPRKTNIVVYCGCCPFEHCPNVRPAIGLLKSMNFTHYALLNLPHNLKVDWLDKGYPRVKKE